MSPLAKRIAILESRRGAPKKYEVTIRGGLPNAQLNQAVSADYVWDRKPTETEEQFRARVWHEANLEEIMFVAFGGLPVKSYDL
jgi:hypothetical protein